MKIVFSAALGILVWMIKAVVELSFDSRSSGGFLPNGSVSHIVFLLELFTGGIVGTAIGIVISNSKIKVGGTTAFGFLLGLVAAVLQSMVYLNPYTDYGNETMSYVLFDTKEVWLNIPAGILTALVISTISTRNNR
jgi:hypothetical protein